MRCVTEVTARSAADVGTRGQRPGAVRVFFWTLLAGVGGQLLGAFALLGPSVVGVAVTQPWLDAPPFYPDGAGAVMADAAALAVLVWGAVSLARPLLAWATGERPAWTWTALPLGGGLALGAVSAGVSLAGGLAVAGVAVRYTAYASDGRARPEPVTVSPRWRIALVSLPALAIAATTAYAMYHPLQGRWWSGGEGTSATEPVRVTRAALRVRNPIIDNTGGRPVRVLAIEPGQERGFALHLVGMETVKPGGARGPDGPRLVPFVLGPHETRDDLTMVISRAGCRPGATGRIDSVRVRYVLGGGQHTTQLRLEHPLTLNC